ncbi:MAG: LamG domain-containing protein [Anaerolineales bacterium]|nr:LamG domain-containing protein [Anaerolineales bacterium]
MDYQKFLTARGLKTYHAGIRVMVLLPGFVLLAAGLTLPQHSNAHPGGASLRFYGNGVNDIDRVKIPLGNPSRPVNVGGDFTLEFWLKADANNQGQATCGANDGWITGNILIDRDIFGALENGDYGLSLHRSGNTRRIAFGVSNGNGGNTLCGNINVADGAWHHVAVTRNASTGQLRIFVDGVLDAQGSGPTGDISYQVGRATMYPNSDPFLVLGAEKHDAGSQYPSFSGWLDDVRLSNIIRYTGDFTRPAAPLTADANTVALYSLDGGPGNCTSGSLITDSSGASGGPSHGECRFGGSPAGPVWSSDTPFSGTPTPTQTLPPTPTPSRTLTQTPTPDATPSICAPDCRFLFLPLVRR